MFINTRFCLVGFPKRDVSSIRRRIRTHGGHPSSRLGRHTNIVLVPSECTAAKLEELRRDDRIKRALASRREINIVTIDWMEESLKENALQTCDWYAAFGLPPRASQVAFGPSTTFEDLVSKFKVYKRYEVEGSGKRYFYDCLSDETQWKPPEDVDERLIETEEDCRFQVALLDEYVLTLKKFLDAADEKIASSRDLDGGD